MNLKIICEYVANFCSTFILKFYFHQNNLDNFILEQKIINKLFSYN